MATPDYISVGQFSRNYNHYYYSDKTKFNFIVHVEGKAFMRLLSEKIAATWHKSNSEVMGYVRARLMFAILRAG